LIMVSGMCTFSEFTFSIHNNPARARPFRALDV
jgi:hypothetical protein